MTRHDIDNVIKRLELSRDNEGYYVDAFNNRVSFNGIRTIKPAFTQLNLKNEHAEEIFKCAMSFQYFRENYCIILTDKGYARPQPRDYQTRLENDLLGSKRNLVLFGRQSGKCTEKSTFITIKNDKLNIPETKLSVETFHNIRKVMHYSLNKIKADRYKISLERLLKTKPFDNFTGAISDIQHTRLTELFNVINNFSLPYNGKWIRGFLDNDLDDNFVLRITTMLEYANNHNSFDSLEYFSLLYGSVKGAEKYNEKCACGLL